MYILTSTITKIPHYLGFATLILFKNEDLFPEKKSKKNAFRVIEKQSSGKFETFQKLPTNSSTYTIGNIKSKVYYVELLVSRHKYWTENCQRN
jgi:hypothetical protein